MKGEKLSTLIILVCLVLTECCLVLQRLTAKPRKREKRGTYSCRPGQTYRSLHEEQSSRMAMMVPKKMTVLSAMIAISVVPICDIFS